MEEPKTLGHDGKTPFPKPVVRSVGKRKSRFLIFEMRSLIPISQNWRWMICARSLPWPRQSTTCTSASILKFIKKEMIKMCMPAHQLMEIKRGHYGQGTQENLDPTLWSAASFHEVSKEKGCPWKMAKCRLDRKMALSYFPHNSWDWIFKCL